MLSKGPVSPALHGLLDYVLGVVLVLAVSYTHLTLPTTPYV